MANGDVQTLTDGLLGQVRLRIGVALQDAALDPQQTGRELLDLQGRLYDSLAWPTPTPWPRWRPRSVNRVRRRHLALEGRGVVGHRPRPSPWPARAATAATSTTVSPGAQHHTGPGRHDHDDPVDEALVDLRTTIDQLAKAGS
jgi:hypothetical protein